MDIKDKIISSKEDMCNAILSVSSEILDSSPATDPRWASSQHKGKGLLNQFAKELKKLFAVKKTDDFKWCMFLKT